MNKQNVQLHNTQESFVDSLVLLGSPAINTDSSTLPLLFSLSLLTQKSKQKGFFFNEKSLLSRLYHFVSVNSYGVLQLSHHRDVYILNGTLVLLGFLLVCTLLHRHCKWKTWVFEELCTKKKRFLFIRVCLFPGKISFQFQNEEHLWSAFNGGTLFWDVSEHVVSR